MADVGDITPEEKVRQYLHSKDAVKPEVLELGQFWHFAGTTYCFNVDCDQCKFNSNGRTCVRKPVELKVGPGINLRRSFRSTPGFLIVSIDYKAIEIRVAAQLSKEPLWIHAFQKGLDLHMEMAKVAFKTPHPTKDQRRQAKCANFGNLFLGSAFTLQRQSDLSLPEATFIHKAWWDAVPTYKAWTDRQLRIAKESGAVCTFFGRKRNLRDLIKKAQEVELHGKTGKGKQGWDFVHRTSVNSPVQGTSADLMKLAMIRVSRWIRQEGLQDSVRLLMTVHDELVFEIQDDAHFFSRVEKIRSLMCPNLASMGWVVPIEVDVEVGYNWAELLSLEQLREERGLSVPKDKKEETRLEFQQETRPKKDYCAVVVNTVLEDSLSVKIEMALLTAAVVPDVVKVPVKIRINGSLFSPSKISSVHEPTLRRELIGIKGVSFEET